ncbi:LTA synthase family protein [Corallococcus sp. H22C18031201]|nr:LTA synthase family protein [Corallococcus sp. H22C18031201]
MMKPTLLARRLLARRHGYAALFVLLFVVVAQLTRVALWVKSARQVSLDSSLLASLLWGLLFDVGAGVLFALPGVVVSTLLPKGLVQGRAARVLAHGGVFVSLFALLFIAAAEWLFWDEFGVRFNFIAVDYLVYTNEVIANIRESYPIPTALAGLAVLAALGTLAVARSGAVGAWLAGPAEPWRDRLRAGGVWLAVAGVVGLGLDSNLLPSFANNYNRELAKNGVWAIFSAFRNNELEYDQFYLTLPVDDAFRRLHSELAEDPTVSMAASTSRDALHEVRNEGTELRPNVIQITVESLSAEFVGAYNPSSKLTPELDRIAQQSLVFDRFYATGNRTDRGMEALTLALPPTPGRSILKRPGNERLFTLGSVFRTRGYDTAFVYGGYGYFDNMNYFFGENGYRVVDRTAVAKEDVTFSTAWGACDEDLFRWVLREADAADAAKKPFFHFVMTTSNHRPYAYPEGRIDLPPKASGRAGAVKYTDYAVGKFLREASTRPWFKNTVFVIVADHCASSAGSTELPIQRYAIPLMIYAPGGQVAPGHVTTLTSQVDYAPTLLGLLNWSYQSRFFGRDVRRIDPSVAGALMGTYQKLALLERGGFAVLKPVRQETQFHYDAKTNALTPRGSDDALLDETIAYYQAASYAFRNGVQSELAAAPHP